MKRDKLRTPEIAGDIETPLSLPKSLLGRRKFVRWRHSKIFSAWLVTNFPYQRCFAGALRALKLCYQEGRSTISISNNDFPKRRLCGSFSLIFIFSLISLYFLLHLLFLAHEPHQGKLSEQARKLPSQRPRMFISGRFPFVMLAKVLNFNYAKT